MFYIKEEYILGIFYYRTHDKHASSTVASVGVRNPTQNK